MEGRKVEEEEYSFKAKVLFEPLARARSLSLSSYDTECFCRLVLPLSDLFCYEYIHTEYMHACTWSIHVHVYAHTQALASLHGHRLAKEHRLRVGRGHKLVSEITVPEATG